MKTVWRKRALQKWYMRVQETQRMRAKWAQFHENYRIRMKFKVWEVLQFKQNVNNTMARVMGNLEYFMRTKMLDDSFKAVKSFSTSKKLATAILKRRAAYDACGFLS